MAVTVMSPSLLRRRIRRLPTSVVLTTALATLLAAVAVLAGSAMGSAGVVICIPIAAAAAMARKRIEARHAGLVHLALMDPLTGLGNARLLRQRMSYEIARHRRHQRQLALL